jgi:hypothetical protein
LKFKNEKTFHRHLELSRCFDLTAILNFKKKMVTKKLFLKYSHLEFSRHFEFLHFAPLYFRKIRKTSKVKIFEKSEKLIKNSHN